MKAIQPTTEDLYKVFGELRAMLAIYAPPLTVTMDRESRYELWSLKPVVIEGRKHTSLSFASLIIQSTYVGFYYMPVYTDTDIKAVFAPDLLALLKGKSCFWIRRLTPELEASIKAALAEGFRRYQEKGWV